MSLHSGNERDSLCVAGVLGLRPLSQPVIVIPRWLATRSQINVKLAGVGDSNGSQIGPGCRWPANIYVLQTVGLAHRSKEADGGHQVYIERGQHAQGRRSAGGRTCGVCNRDPVLPGLRRLGICKGQNRISGSGNFVRPKIATDMRWVGPPERLPGT